MKRTLFVALIMGLVSGLVQAAPVSESAARVIAAQFMAKKQLGNISTATPRMLRGKGTNQPALYVFNAEKSGCGWVIVSGDDRTQQVLGYSDSGTYDENNIPENMQWWLSQYVEEIASLDDSDNSGLPVLGSLESDRHSAMPKAAPIAPLIQTKWNQNSPYNLQCPEINSNHCVTGCVATSMAQVMYYHQWPDMISREIPAYYWNRGKTTLSSLAGAGFNWNAMKKTYSSSDTDPTVTANFAVARLMRYCGQSVEMDYGLSGDGGSGAVSSCEVFSQYFKYSTKARKLFRFDYSYSQWVDLIVAELRANRPVMCGGQKYNGGHSFICDGYDGTGYFHFNWGWSGDNDGYFLLTSLNPDGGGIGSAVGNNGYVQRHNILIGLEPNTVSTTERNSVTECSGISAGSTSYTRSSSSDPFVINVTANFSNHSPVSRTYDLGWGVYEADGHTLRQYYTTLDNNHTLGRYEETTMTKSLNFGKNFPNGVYFLRPISKESANSTWMPCHFSGTDYIYAYINGNNLMLSARNFGGINGVTASIKSYGTLKKKNRPLEVTVGATNHGLADNIPFYLLEDNKLVGANSLNLAINYSSTVVISYTPTSAGTKTLKVTADKSGNNVYCTGSVTVAAPSAASMSMTYYVTGANSSNNYTTYSGSLPYVITIKNNGTSVYNDYVVGKLYKKSSDGDYLVAEKNLPFNISAGSQDTGHFTFENLKPGDYYAKFYYYNYDDLAQALYTYTYHVKSRGDVNGDGVVSSVDVTALYNYLLNNDSSSIVNGDVDGDGHITSVDITAVYNIILGS